MAPIFVALGLVAGVPVVGQFAATGMVPKLPTALLVVGLLAFTCGLIPVCDWLVRHALRFAAVFCTKT